jgi:ribosomal protein S5
MTVSYSHLVIVPTHRGRVGISFSRAAELPEN